MENNQKRHICITIWSLFCIAFNVTTVIISLLRIPMLGWYVALPAALDVVNVYAIILILKWRRVGFYLLLVSAVLFFVYNLEYMGFSTYLCTGLLSPLFWFLMLQFKNNDGVKCWTMLE